MTYSNASNLPAGQVYSHIQLVDNMNLAGEKKNSLLSGSQMDFEECDLFQRIFYNFNPQR